MRKFFKHFYEPESVNEDSTEGIKYYLEQIRSLEGSREDAFEQLVDEFEFSKQKAEYYLQVYWDKLLG